ncbi:major histocompatibility complex class I-related gene protein-like isoform X1 [Pseudonaja textilis]|uniref:major histocompatibility complex class I-related gene protein-like isoform X1 n=1 Tax=Pseudonaja textilis TaxID=8673 RepID=UPI000EA8935A|nr:major histocompatibility complex class I-related gene protein-like isoform X1 [Pseudonaja textilis]
MLFHSAPLWLLGAAGGFILLRGTCCGSSKHSLSYSYLQVSGPSQELPQFLSMVHLDDQPIARYDNHTRMLEPLVPWMEMVKMKSCLDPDWIFRADLKSPQNGHPQNEGLHTWQAILGCELGEDGSKGYFHYGYDGMDFISFDKETFRWVTAQPQAQKVKEEWEDHPGWFQENKHFLEETCPVLLKRYLSFGKEALQRTEPPVGKVNSKVVDDNLEVLTCQAFGFYPKEIQTTWTRDGEACVYETLRRNVAPNSDGTYYVWLSIEIDPKEKNHYWCHVMHDDLQEPLLLAWKEKPDEKLQHPARERFVLLGTIPLVLLLALMTFLRKCFSSRRMDETALE